MFVTRRKAILLALFIFTTETHAITCGYGSIGKSKEDTDTTLEDVHPGKPLTARKQCNVEWVTTYKTENEGYVPVNCGRCSIYNLNVLAKRNRDVDDKICSGLTPELFSSSRNCMWKNNCVLRYVQSPIVWSPPNCPRCIGEEPGTVDVGYSCLDPDTPIDDVMKGYQAVESEHGLIRSHNYDAKHRRGYLKNLSKHVMEITPPANFTISWKDYFVMLYVVTFNINKDDKLIISDVTLPAEDVNSETCENLTWRTGDTHNVSFSTLRFEFALGSSPALGKGFDICFQWFEQGNTNAQAIFEETVKSCIKCHENKHDCPKFDVIRDTATQEPRGIIRSHNRHPWNYPRPERTIYSSVIHTWSSHVHVLLAPNTLNLLEVEVQQMELGWGDRLLVIDEKKRVSDKELGKASQQCPTCPKTSLHYFKGHRVTFNFSVYDSTVSTNSGFLICYQWRSPDQEVLRTTSLCDEFVYPVDPCDKKAKKKNKQVDQKCNLGMKKPQGKKDKRKSGKNTSKEQKAKRH